MSGVPIGDIEYVRSKLKSKGESIVQHIETITDVLHDYPQALQTTLRLSLAHRADHWMRHCYPADTEDMARTIDEALDAVVRHTIPSDPLATEVSRRRYRLPLNFHGGGVRSQVDIRPIAFIAGATAVVPLWHDKLLENGAVCPGFAPQLTEFFQGPVGTEGFHEGSYDPLFHSNTRMGAALRDAWA